MQEIGKRIKACRIKLDISAEELAPLVGLSPATIYRYENGGIQKVNTNKLQLFARALKTTESYLMGWDEEKENNIPIIEHNGINTKYNNSEILYISKPSGDMHADEIRKFLHELIDELKDEDLMLMKDLSLRMAKRDV